MDAKLIVFAVARPPEPATSVELEAVLDDAREHCEEVFENYLARRQGITFKTQLPLVTRDQAVALANGREI